MNPATRIEIHFGIARMSSSDFSFLTIISLASEQSCLSKEIKSVWQIWKPSRLKTNFVTFLRSIQHKTTYNWLVRLFSPILTLATHMNETPINGAFLTKTNLLDYSRRRFNASVSICWTIDFSGNSIFLHQSFSRSGNKTFFHQSHLRWSKGGSKQWWIFPFFSPLVFFPTVVYQPYFILFFFPIPRTKSHCVT